MTDRELLELAAKAAGIKLAFNGYGKVPEGGSVARFIGEEIYFFSTRPGQGNVLWNPLTDDGDALRLCVKLDIQIWRRPSGVEGVHKGSVLTSPTTEPLEPDRYAATRRAIVRAAAEVGKGMLSHDEFVLMFPDRFEPEEVERARAAAEIGRAMP